MDSKKSFPFEIGMFFILFFGVASGFFVEKITHKQWRSFRKISGCEASTIGALKGIASIETDYNNNTNPHSYGTLSQLCKEQEKSLEIYVLDSALCSGIRSGYKIEMNVSCQLENGSYWCWSATAWPVTYGESGKRTFCIDQTGLIRGSDIGGKTSSIILPLIEPSY
ncbi:DUF2950 domain-containing protein [bacterium]|nr:DUF2950 domain-containing protein [bacterium]